MTAKERRGLAADAATRDLHARAGRRDAVDATLRR